MSINFSHKEFESLKNTYSIKKSANIEDYVSQIYLTTFTGFVSLSKQLGFDRKIYLHIITEESEIFTEIPVSRIY